MKRKLTLLLIALLMLLNYMPGVAFEKPSTFCECAKRNDIKSEIEASDAIFVGEVIEIKNSQPDAIITFKVERIWKGDKTEKLLIFTDNRGKACGYNFKKGERYLVYAYKRDGELHTDICSRTATVNTAGDDLKKLDNESAHESN